MPPKLPFEANGQVFEFICVQCGKHRVVFKWYTNVHYPICNSKCRHNYYYRHDHQHLPFAIAGREDEAFDRRVRQNFDRDGNLKSAGNRQVS